MSFNIVLYSYSKKVNSTSRPGGGTTISGVVKEPLNIIAPMVSFDLGLASAPQYNYAYIAAFGRYYYITEWTYTTGLWTASMSSDSLASFRGDIGATTCYVLRAASQYDNTIQDLTYPTTNDTTQVIDTMSQIWEPDNIANNKFVVGLAGISTTYYIFTASGLANFLQYIMSDAYAESITTNWSAVYPELKAATNPLQYITKIMMMPYPISGLPTSSIKVGWADVAATADSILSPTYTITHTWTLARHPQATLRGEYLNNAPYSYYTLFMPPWGILQLDSDTIANTPSSITTHITLDVRTGSASLTVTGGADDHVLAWSEGQIGLDYQISQIINTGFGIGDMIQPVVSGLSSVVGAIGGGPAGAVQAGLGVISSAASAIGNMAKANVPYATTIGKTGSSNSLQGTPRLQYDFKTVVDEDLTNRGRPLCKSVQISTLSGFILVSDADISSDATKAEQDEIRQYMQGGFFYE